MRRVIKITKRYYLRQIAACFLVSCLFFNTSVLLAIEPGSLTGSTGLIGATWGDNTVINTDNGAILNWSNFNTIAGQSVTFNQYLSGSLNSSSAVLNRISSGAIPTQFDGALNANGRVFIVNPAGVIFGCGATVNVAQLVASSLNISNSDFTNGLASGAFIFTDGVNAGKVRNYGLITADRIALIGKSVTNRGVLTGQYIVMVAADNVILRPNGPAPVMVEFDLGGNDPADFLIKQYDDDSLGNSDNIILAAGDIYSAAIDGVETLRAEIKGSIGAENLEGIYAYDDADSDAAASVDIISGGDITIDDDIEAVAVGDGINDATAAVTITSDGDVDVTTNDWDGIAVKAIAVGGSNNNADVTITAVGNAKVIADDGGNVQIKAVAVDGTNNNADVTITAADNVKVIGSGWGSGPVSEAKIKAVAVDGENNTANVDVTAGGDVKVLGINGGQAQIEAVAKYADVSNSANVGITAENGCVLVLGKGGAYNDGFTSSEASIEAMARGAGEEGEEGSSNSANITIVANDIVEEPVADVALTSVEEDEKDGDVLVIGVDGGKAEIEAKAMEGADNSAGVDITAADDVKVKAKGYGSGPVSEAEIMALAKYAFDNTANITIGSSGDVVVLGKDSGQAQIEAIAKEADISNTANITIDTVGDVKVLAIWGDSLIEAYASSSSNNTANVSIDTLGYIEVKAAGCDAGIYAEATEGIQNNASVAVGGVGHKTGNDVQVIAEHGHAYIEAYAYDGEENNADVLVCTESQLDVLAGISGEYGDDGEKWASIGAYAELGYLNNASVGIGADDGILVQAESCGSAEILAGAYNGYTNSAQTIACTKKGDLWVVGNGGYAAIGSEAIEGEITDAFTAVCAEGDIIVAAGFNPQDIIDSQVPWGIGGEAFIYSEAGGCYESGEDSAADAGTVAVSKKGSVVVGEITGEGIPDTAGIIAEAFDAYKNTANVGIAAGADLTPAEVIAIQDVDFEGFILPGDVYVLGFGDWSNARIMAEAYNGYENTADTVVCAPGEVFVEAYGYRSLAKIKSLAESGELNEATTQVYASDFYVDVPGLYRGNGIGAWAIGSPWLHIPSQYCLTEDGAVALTDGGSILVIDTYANRQDCPTCPPCPCEEGTVLLDSVPPVPVIRVPEIEGCPAIIDAAAQEIGIPRQDIQLAIARALSGNVNIQPCDMCSRLIASAAILRDPDGSRMAALADVINSVAPANVPYTSEVGTMIATAFEENRSENSQYAKAMEYVEAFVQYVSIIQNEMAPPIDDPVAFTIDKYGTELSEQTNPNVAAYIAARLAEIVS